MEDLMPQLFKLLIPTLITAITAIVAYVGKLLGEFIKNKVVSSRTQVDDALAAQAVRWAETWWKSDEGLDKRHKAIAKLVEISKGKLTLTDAELLIGSAYTSVIKPLKEIAGND